MRGQVGGFAITVSSLTTVASVFANLVSPIKPIREFGLYTGSCVFATVLVTLLAFPPLLVLWDQPRNSLHERSIEGGRTIA